MGCSRERHRAIWAAQVAQAALAEAWSFPLSALRSPPPRGPRGGCSSAPRGRAQAVRGDRAGAVPRAGVARPGDPWRSPTAGPAAAAAPPAGRTTRVTGPRARREPRSLRAWKDGAWRRPGAGLRRRRRRKRRPGRPRPG